MDPRDELETFYETSWRREIEKFASLKKFEAMHKTLYHKPEKTHEKDAIMITTLNLRGFFKNKNKQTKKVSQSSQQGWQRKIDLYPFQEYADADNDILEWWCRHEKFCPTFSSMARDLLTF